MLCLCLAAVLATAPSTTSSLPGSNSESGSVRAEPYLWQDFDRDGLVDLYVRAPAQPDRLLRNAGGSFEDVTAARGLADVGATRAAAWKDFDLDGLPDLLVIDAEGRCRLFRNAGSTFVDVTASAGIEHPTPARAVEWIDENRDGAPDLHVVTASSDTIFENLGSGAGRFSAIRLPTLPAAVPTSGGDEGGTTFGVVRSGFASGASNTPSATLQFLSPPVTVTVGAGDSIFVDASRAFGSNYSAGAQSLSLWIGRRQLPSGPILVLGSGMIGNRVTRSTRQPFALSGIITGLTAGSYEVGLVGGSSNTHWDNNGSGYTSALVFQ
jgi:hypothetical protein